MQACVPLHRREGDGAVEELAAFPYGRNDDQVDALTRNASEVVMFEDLRNPDAHDVPFEIRERKGKGKGKGAPLELMAAQPLLGESAQFVPRPGISLDSALGTFNRENVLKERMHVQREETRCRGVRGSP